MEFYQIRYCLALCETLNFTRAAEKCHVSQPSLTRAIKLLEDELGGPLFYRERNRTHLTELGRMMRPYFEQVYSQTVEAKSRARRMLTLSEASLRVGVMNAIATSRVTGVFDRFQSNHPGVELHLTEAKCRDLCEMLAHGEMDTALYAAPEPEPPEFHALPLFRERFMIGVRRGHRFEGLNGVRLKDLAGERYLVRERCEYVPYIDQLLQDSDVALAGRYRSDRDDWISAMASAGLGFCFLPEDALGQADLVVRPLVEPELERTVNLLTVRGRPHSAALGAFVREATQFGREAFVAAAAA